MKPSEIPSLLISFHSDPFHFHTLPLMKTAFVFAMLATLAASSLPAAQSSAEIERRVRKLLDAPVTIEPIKIPERCVTLKDEYADDFRWAKEVIVEPMRKRVAGKQRAAEALDFVEKALAVYFFVSKEMPPEWLAKGRKIIDAGQSDPVVLWMFSRFEFESGNRTEEVEATMAAAIESASAKRLPAGVLRWMGLDDREMREALEIPNDELLQRIFGWTTAMCEDGSYAPEEDYVIIRQLLGGGRHREFFYDFQEEFLAIANKAKLPEWARLTIIGNAENSLAWQARGMWAPDKVPKAATAKMTRHLKAAYPALRRAWELRPDRPEAAERMMSIVHGAKSMIHGISGGARGADISARAWFDRTCAAVFDLRRPYIDYAWSVGPEWGGDLEHLMAFGDACLATKRFDTQVPIFYMEILGMAENRLGKKRILLRQPEIAEKVIALQEALLAEPTRVEERHARHARFAVAAWACARYDIAARELDAAKGDLAPAASSIKSHGYEEATIREEIELFRQAAK